MKLLIIYNPFSGKGNNNKIDKLKELLSPEFEIDEFRSYSVGSITRYIINDMKHDYDVVLVCGGDGTVNESLRAITKLDYYPKIAVYPAGTINDFAHYLKMSKNVKKTAKYILNMKTIKHTIYHANDSAFVYGFALGALSNISYEKSSGKRLFGRLSYYFIALKEIFKSKTAHITLTSNNLNIETKCNLVLATSTNRIAGYRIKKKNDLSVVIFKGLRFFYPIKLFMYFVFGIAKNKYELSEFSINSDLNEFNTDGECNNSYSTINIKKLKEYDFISK